MKTKAELINALEDAQRQGVQFVTYGDGDLGIVFPMHVGVFLEAKIADGSADGLPHARGGVSHDDETV